MSAGTHVAMATSMMVAMMHESNAGCSTAAAHAPASHRYPSRHARGRCVAQHVATRDAGVRTTSPRRYCWTVETMRRSM